MVSHTQCQPLTSAGRRRNAVTTAHQPTSRLFSGSLIFHPQPLNRSVPEPKSYHCHWHTSRYV